MATENTPVVAPVADENSVKESALKLEQLQIQVELARLDLKRKRRDDGLSEKQAELDLRQKTNATEKSMLELKAAQRAEETAAASDIENGEFTFCDGVTWDSAKLAIAETNKLSRRNAGKPLSIILNSPGGSVIAGLALYDHFNDLRKRGHHLTVKCRGMAASMGGILLQSGDKRVIGAESRVLIHEVSSGTYGKVGDMQDDLNFSKGLWEQLSVILAKRSTMTPKQIRAKAHKFDWWVGAEEAVKLGFADEIG